jgi:hypothetical protein
MKLVVYGLLLAAVISLILVKTESKPTALPQLLPSEIEWIDSMDKPAVDAAITKNGMDDFIINIAAIVGQNTDCGRDAAVTQLAAMGKNALSLFPVSPSVTISQTQNYDAAVKRQVEYARFADGTGRDSGKRCKESLHDLLWYTRLFQRAGTK